MSGGLRNLDLKRFEPGLGAALGIAVFLGCFGLTSVDPGNVGWLMKKGDTPQALIAGLYFLNSPWEWPWGKNSFLGMDVATSIGFTDSLPLVAFPLKLLAPLLPVPFQYLGLWVLLSFGLQGLFAWMLMQRLTDSRLLCAIGSGFFLFSFPAWSRLVWHHDLAAHWIVLASLVLYLSERPRWVAWTLLFVVAVWVHPYFLMILAIYAADIGQRFWRGELTGRRALAVGAATLAATWAALWLAGYFVVPKEAASGGSYGFFRMNVLSPVDPSWVDSPILKNLPETPGDYEGFNYLGLGMILLLVAAGYERVSRGPFAVDRRRLIPLVGACLALTLFAVSNKIAVGGANLVEVPLPGSVLRVCETFRSSGRFFWPVYYLLFLTGLAGVICRTSARRALGICGAALAIQLADGWPDGLAEMRQALGPQAPTWTTPLQDEAWDVVVNRYRRIRFAPAALFGFIDDDFDAYMAFGYLGATNRMPMNSGMFARYDGRKVGEQIRDSIERLRRCDLDREAIYVFRSNDPQLWLDALRAARGTDHGFGIVDGYRVLAPHWMSFPEASGLSLLPAEEFLARLEEPAAPPATAESAGPPPRPKPRPAELSPGGSAEFTFGNEGNAGARLGPGWSHQESWGTWSDGDQATIVLPCVAPAGAAVVLTIDGHAYVNERHPRQTIRVVVNGDTLADETYTLADTGGRRTIVVPAETAARTPGQLTIGLTFPDAAAPATLGLGDDSRRLGIHLGFISLAIGE
jgi:hypothetical protein